jgi:hypothetical protein
MKSSFSKLLILGAVSFMVLSGCGSSGSSSTSGSASSTISKGVITGFGSVFVNGVEYKTASSKLYKPDSSTTPSTLGSSETEIQNHLKIGMIVTIKGSSDGTSGQATEIEFKDNLKGLVTAKTATTLTILGITVNVDSATKLYSSSGSGTTLASIVPGTTWVEISGLPDNTGAFNATYIEMKSSTGTEQELKGYIVASTAGSFDLGLTTGITSVTINAPLPAGIAVGNYVEVKFDAAGNFIKVEVEDDLVKADENTAKAEAEGYISAISGDTITVNVNGTAQTVNLTATTAYFLKSANDVTTTAVRADLAVGKKVSAEGPLSAGVITATKIKIRTS